MTEPEITTTKIQSSVLNDPWIAAVLKREQQLYLSLGEDMRKMIDAYHQTMCDIFLHGGTSDDD